MKNVVIANDHGGVDLALKLIEHLKERGYSCNHLGCYDSSPVDYPDMADKAVEEYKRGGYDFGLLVCGTGIGISIRANKHSGIVCALPQNIFASAATKEHNGANFIAFGGRIDYPDDPVKMLDAYIDTTVSDDPRHERRREKLNSKAS